MTIAAVVLGEGVRDAIVAHALEAAPDECCGLLVGNAGAIDEAVRTPNVDPKPSVRYEVDPAVHVALIRRLRGSGRDVVGCYHSHPHSPALPSPADVEAAHYPGFIWLIVSLVQRGGPELRAFHIDGDAGGAVVELAVHHLGVE